MTASDGAGPDREATPWVCDLHGDRYGSDGCPSCDRNRQAFADLVDSARHCDRCHRPLPHTDAERAACPCADGVEEVVALREQVARVRAEVEQLGALSVMYTFQSNGGAAFAMSNAQHRILAALDAAPKEPRPVNLCIGCGEDMYLRECPAHGIGTAFDAARRRGEHLDVPTYWEQQHGSTST